MQHRLQFAALVWPIICLGALATSNATFAHTHGVPNGASPCQFEAWVVDADGKVNVRAAPSQKAFILGTLPAAIKHLGSPDEGATVTVIASKGDFFMIKTVDADKVERGGPAQKPDQIFRGRGWIHGSRLTFAIQRADGLRSAAAVKAPVTIRIRTQEPDGSGEPDAYVVRLHSCRGGKIEATLRTVRDKPLGRGWLITEVEKDNLAPVQICANQLTTCG
ncbi:MAG: SH3 domain-containing protein [Beijerinckiaceae bacterium]|nr:SH3 domain-containing protein [Brevundimonas sp.]MCZ8302116.1 SH3 domain-containing protein [Beijerinckiaceae bacterium]